MTVATLIVAIAALLVAYQALRRSGAVDQRLAEVSGELQRVRAQLQEARRYTDARLKEMGQGLHGELPALRFSPSMTIAEAMAVHPGVADVLSSFHLNSCSNCAISDVDTLEGASRSYGIDETALMAALDALLQPRTGDLLQTARAQAGN